MKPQKNKLKPVDLAKEFNRELENYLFRIRGVLAYYTKKPEELKESKNAKYVAQFCEMYLNLRGILREKYGFDYGMYDKKWEPDESGKLREVFYLPNNKTGINVDPELLNKDSRTHKSVVDMIKKITGRDKNVT